jgi:hypothetical protein
MAQWVLLETLMWVNMQRITGVAHCANVMWPDLEAPFAETYLVTNGRDVYKVQHGKDDVWSLLQQPGQRSFPWIILDLAQTVTEVREAVQTERRKAL